MEDYVNKAAVDSSNSHLIITKSGSYARENYRGGRKFLRSLPSYSGGLLNSSARLRRDLSGRFFTSRIRRIKSSHWKNMSRNVARGKIYAKRKLLDKIRSKTAYSSISHDSVPSLCFYLWRGLITPITPNQGYSWPSMKVKTQLVLLRPK